VTILPHLTVLSYKQKTVYINELNYIEGDDKNLSRSANVSKNVIDEI
jgi:uncharacterized protein related to proFAR isomerase